MLIDLSMPLSEETPVYPGDPKVEVLKSADLATDGFLDHMLHIGMHNGTHIDAPAHMIESGKMLSAFGVDRFIGSGIILDVRKGDADCSNVRAGDIVLLRTDISNEFNAPRYYESTPNISVEMMQELVRFGVKMVGVDAGSIDEPPFPLHKSLLGNEVLLIENLVGLSRVNDDRVEVIALPLNVGLEASPARVIVRTF